MVGTMRASTAVASATVVNSRKRISRCSSAVGTVAATRGGSISADAAMTDARPLNPKARSTSGAATINATVAASAHNRLAQNETRTWSGRSTLR